MIFLFYLLSFVCVIAAGLVVFTKSPINSVIYLIVCFLGIAGHYILLNAQFLAIVHVIVYMGAIMVLFLFVIMLLNLNKQNLPHKHITTRISSVVAGGLLFLVLIAATKSAVTFPFPEHADTSIGLVKTVGKKLYTEYMLPFEIASVLFLAAIVGSVFFGNKKA